MYAALKQCRDRLWQWFESVDTDRSGHISAEELQRALINGDWSRKSIVDLAPKCAVSNYQSDE